MANYMLDTVAPSTPLGSRPTLQAPGRLAETHLSITLIVPSVNAVISWYRSALGASVADTRSAACE